jgi:hypothetical protein
MTKTFCDICQKEINDQNIPFTWVRTSFRVDDNTVRIAHTELTSEGRCNDLCDKCVIEKVIKGLCDYAQMQPPPPKTIKVVPGHYRGCGVEQDKPCNCGKDPDLTSAHPGITFKNGGIQFGQEPKLTADDRIGILQSALNDACEEAFKAQDILTRDQFVEALMQAIKCGDFVKYVRVTDGAQQVIYLPFQREQELEGKIRELEIEIDSLKANESRTHDDILGEDA